MSTGEAPAGVALRFFLPPRRLRPFITTLYPMEISGAEDEPVVDWLHPEWANLRIIPDRTECVSFSVATRSKLLYVGSASAFREKKHPRHRSGEVTSART